MRQLKWFLATILVVCLPWGVGGCATTHGSQTSAGMNSGTKSSEADYWRSKYESERKKNQTEGAIRAGREFGEGMDRINENLDDFNKTLDGVTERLREHRQHMFGR